MSAFNHQDFPSRLNECQDILTKITDFLKGCSGAVKAKDIAQGTGIGQSRSDVNRYLYFLKNHNIIQDNGKAEWTLMQEVKGENLQVLAAQLASTPGGKSKGKLQQSVVKPDIDDDQKRWLIVGICLHSVISPALRQYIPPIVSKLYSALKRTDQVDKQTFAKYLIRYKPTNKELNYEAINNNSAIPKVKGKKDVQKYNYNVTSDVDLTKLFMITSMAHYTGFDDTCDSLALLGIIINIDTFPALPKQTAKKVRADIRNPWAHCNFYEWDVIKYQNSFQLMHQFIWSLQLPVQDETAILGKLTHWQTNGVQFLQGGTLGVELVQELENERRALSKLILDIVPQTGESFKAVHNAVLSVEGTFNETTDKINHLVTDTSGLKGNLNELTDTVDDLQDAHEQHSDTIEKIKTDIEGSLPEEILRMDENSISLYKKALMEGKQAINNIRVMIVGHCGVGKTTLTKKLFGETVDVKEDIASTNGIDVHIKRCKVHLTDANWLPVSEENYQETFYNRFASMISEFSKNTGLQQSGTDVKSSAKEINLDADKACSITSDKTSINKKQADDPDSKQEFKQQEDKSESLLYERESNENKKATDMHLKKMIEDIKNRCTQDSSKDIADLSVWDFAGQYVFYGTHQIFLSRRAIYLLVTDLSQQVDSIVDDDCYIDSRGETRCKISDFVTFWLNSIHTFCASGKSREPPVILVGTFADKLIEGKKQELADEFFDKLRLNLAQSEAFVHLTDAEFMIDNSVIDPNVEKLKREIVMTATKQSYWGELYPARWAILERSMMEFKERGHTVLEKKVLEDTNKNMPLPIETSEELELFLRFHHEAGFLLYFSDGKLKDFILLQPQWLVDALKSLITARKLCTKDQELSKCWLTFSKTGILKRELIDAVWSDRSPFHKHKDLILEFMEKLGIIARPRQCAVHIDDDVEFYVAPCVLKQAVPDSLIMFNCGDCRSTTKLCFTTPSRIIPVQMFNKLLAECITKWPISKQNEQYLMFCGCGVFDLTDMHEIYVYLRDNVIQIWINTYSEFTECDRDLCLDVRDYITESLRQSVRGSCEIETYVACPKSSLKETQCMWKVDDLSKKTEIRCSGHGRRHGVLTSEILKYWFPNITDDDIFTAAFLKQTPNEKQLSRMAQKIGKEFRSLGFELGMSRAELDHIDMDEKNRTPADKITAMLSYWLKKSACDATFEELKRAMIKTGIDPKNVLTGL